MTTHSEYLCYACDITMKFRGYHVDQPITCPQCSDPMIMGNAEISYGSEPFLGESFFGRPYSHRIYTPAFPSAPLIPEMTRNEIEELIRNSITVRLEAIDKTATNARLTAESMRQSVVDQQSILDKAKFDLKGLKESQGADARAITQQSATIKRLVDETGTLARTQDAMESTVRVLDDRTHGLGTALEAAENTLSHTAETVRRLDMSYVEEESAKTDTAPSAAPAAVAAAAPSITDIAKTVGGAVAQGAILGATGQFIAEVTDAVVAKALKAGMITPALAESTMFKEGLKFLLPMIMMAVAQLPSCPKREFFGKVGELAVRGQSAQHAAMVTALVMGFVSEMTALPSASGLEDRLSAAE